MSQMEMLMFAALALAVVALVALLAGRFAWSMARDIRKWRARRSQPDEVAVLRAERDRLKAEHAMLTRRLELRLSEIKERFAHQEAEVSRARNRTGILAEKLEAAAKVISDRDSEIKSLKELAASLEADLEKRTAALHEARDTIRKQHDRIKELETQREKLKQEIGDRERQLAILREEITATASADAALANSADMNAEERLALKIAELNKMAKQLESQRAKLGGKPVKSLSPRAEPEPAGMAAASRDDAKDDAKKETGESGGETGGKLNGKLEEAERHAVKLDGDLRKLDDLWQDKLASLKTIDEAIAKGEGKKAAGAAAKTRTPPAGAEKKDKPAKAVKARKAAKGKKTAKSAKSAGKNSEAKPKKAAKTSSEQPEEARNVVSLAARIRALKKQSK